MTHKLVYITNGNEAKRGHPITVFDDVAILSDIIMPSQYNPQGSVSVSFPHASRPRIYNPYVIGAKFILEESADAQHQEHQAVPA